MRYFYYKTFLSVVCGPAWTCQVRCLPEAQHWAEPAFASGETGPEAPESHSSQQADHSRRCCFKIPCFNIEKSLPKGTKCLFAISSDTGLEKGFF